MGRPLFGGEFRKIRQAPRKIGHNPAKVAKFAQIPQTGDIPWNVPKGRALEPNNLRERTFCSKVLVSLVLSPSL